MGVPSSYTRCVVDFSFPILKLASLSIIIHNFIQELCDAEILNVQKKN